MFHREVAGKAGNVKSKENQAKAKQLSEAILYKIDIPANRYDLLCLEGIVRALRIFKGVEDVPNYHLSGPPVEKVIVKEATAQIRPVVVAAVLRNVTFTEASYNSFLDLQDKLHFNICRKRTLVAIGTHDLDTIKGPFVYDARPPQDIKFQPLFQEKEFRADELMKHYETDVKLKAFLHIIRDSPVYPVIVDSNDVVCSMPPIINGEHSKLTLDTKNIFIECTATDYTKANIVLNTMLAMYGQYCGDKFAVEPVEVTKADGTTEVFPHLEPHVMDCEMDYVNSIIGTELDAEYMTKALTRMQLPAKPKAGNERTLEVTVPITRSDILHPCDIAEDVAIAFGYNNLTETVPQTNTVGTQQPVNKLTDLLRLESALAGFTETLTLCLCSYDELFAKLKLKEEGNQVVTIANPATYEYQCLRNTLLPGMLKTIYHNKSQELPLKLFEISDIIVQDPSVDVGARNQRNLLAIQYSNSTGFEVVHGLLDLLMKKLGVQYIPAPAEGAKKAGGVDLSPKDNFYYIREGNCPTFFPGRAADVFFNDVKIGHFGVLHPEVLKAFDLTSPASALEIDLTPFV